MNWDNIVLPLLAFLIVFNSIYFSFAKGQGLKPQYRNEFILGLMIMGFSCWFEWSKSDQINNLQNGNDTLNKNVNLLLNKRNIDSADNSNFQKYLKDTFGIIKQGDKPVIYNTTIYNSKVERIEGKPEGLPDSINYSFNFRNDTLYLAPKTGRWEHGYFAFDTSNGAKFESMLFDGMGTANVIDKIIVNNKTLNTHLFKISDKPVYKGEPITLKMTGDLNRYIIFGDQGIPSKRYFYKQRKVSWIPEN